MQICKTVEGAAQTIVCAVSDSLEWVPTVVVVDTGLATTAVVFISACVALWGISSHRRTAARRATLDLIEKGESTEHYQNLHETFRKHRRAGTLQSLHAPKSEEDKKDRAAIHAYLNHYELISSGIKSKILDEKFYSNWMRGPFLRDWNAAADWIQRERWKYDEEIGAWTYRHALFEHFQDIAVKWSPKAKNIGMKSSAPPAEPDGPGDEALPDGAGTDQTTVDSDPEDPSTWGRVLRNAPCPCGSGKKYKHCHGKDAD